MAPHRCGPILLACPIQSTEGFKSDQQLIARLCRSKHTKQIVDQGFCVLYLSRGIQRLWLNANRIREQAMLTSSTIRYFMYVRHNVFPTLLIIAPSL
jgi:hypothetical protein